MFHFASKLPRGLFKSCIIPRPIAWISTINTKGDLNIAPFSYFNALCDNPPMIMFSTTDTHADGGPKDTLKNSEETGEFVINIATWQMREAINASSANLSRGVSEFDYAKIEHTPSTTVKPPGVKGAPIRLECRYYQSVQLPRPSEKEINRMVIGTVLGIYIDPNYMDENNKVDIEKIQPIARLGGNDYARLASLFTMVRPDAPKPNKEEISVLNMNKKF